MDETRIIADQRLDLIDHTRLMTQLQEAFGDILGWLLGNPQYYSTASATDTQARPLIVYNFDFSNPAGLQIKVDREWTSGGDNLNALIYDKDGQRLTGPNSPTTQTYVAPAAPGATTRFLIARRVADDTTNETRQFYTAAAGKYSAATDTRTIDSWEISESIAETAVNTSAASQAALKNAGWVDIATFTTDGAANITLITPAVPDISNISPPLTWAVSPPAVDRYPLNIGELFGSLEQLIARMRYGNGVSSRNWIEDPTYDACFEDEGGIRLAGGVTAVRGLEDIYVRAKNGAATNKLISLEKDSPANSDDLHIARGRAFIAGNNTDSGAPSTTNGSGFLYSSTVTATSYPTHLATVDKYWSVDACGMLPTNQGGSGVGSEPWAGCAGGAPPNDLVEFELVEQLDGAGYNYIEWLAKPNLQSTGAGWFEGALVIPINVPDGCRLYGVTVKGSSAGMPSWMRVGTWIIRKGSASSRTVLNTGGSPIPTNYGAGNFTHNEFVTSTAASYTVDNSTYHYFAAVQISASGSGGPTGNTFSISGAQIRTQIREASHIY